MPIVTFDLNLNGHHHVLNQVDTDSLCHMDLTDTLTQVTLRKDFDSTYMKYEIMHVWYVGVRQHTSLITSDQELTRMIEQYKDGDVIHINFTIEIVSPNEISIVLPLPVIPSPEIRGYEPQLGPEMVDGLFDDIDGMKTLDCDVDLNGAPNMLGPGLFGMDLGEGEGEDETFRFSDDDADPPCNEKEFRDEDEDDSVEENSDQELSDYGSDVADILNHTSGDEFEVDEDDEENNEYLFLHEYKDTPDGRVELKKGQSFLDVNHFREKLIDHIIQQGRVIKFIKNEKNRVVARCVNNACTWIIRATPYPSAKHRDYVIKTLKGRHNCTKKTKNKWANVKWLATKLGQVLLQNQDWNLTISR